MCAGTVVTAIVAAGACGGRARTDDIAASWTVDPPTPGLHAPARIVLSLTDVRDRSPVRGAALQIDAHMAHPGMAPLVVAATEQPAGRYTAHVQFTMDGAWTLVASGTLADGRQLTRSDDIRVVEQSP